jgi:sortase (surface protein transpeptidase)
MTTKIVAFIMAIAVGVFAVTLVHAVWYAPDLEVTDNSIVATSTVPHAQVVTGDYPVRLEIPKLTINANVQKVGIAKSGHMAVPNNFTDAAWYKYGAAPGQAGDAVFDGHVDNGLSLPGVFKQLGSIAVGDDIYVETASGTRLHFVVSDIQQYPYLEVPMNSIVSTTGEPRLSLITCEGAWVQGQKTYDHRLVVYAKMV